MQRITGFFATGASPSTSPVVLPGPKQFTSVLDGYVARRLLLDRPGADGLQQLYPISHPSFTGKQHSANRVHNYAGWQCAALFMALHFPAFVLRKLPQSAYTAWNEAWRSRREGVFDKPELNLSEADAALRDRLINDHDLKQSYAGAAQESLHLSKWPPSPSESMM